MTTKDHRRIHGRARTRHRARRLLAPALLCAATLPAAETPFGPAEVITSAADGARAVLAEDLDGDGDRDVLSASFNDNEIAWYENLDGAGTFGPQQVISDDPEGLRSIAAADLDADGDVDVLAVSESDDTVAWYENLDGQGAFGAERVISEEADGAFTVVTADFDRDGDLDVASGSRFDQEISWYANLDGAGTFGPPSPVASGVDVFSLFAADVDLDGDADLLAASQADDTIAWYENLDGAGSFGPRQVITTEADGAFAVIAADVDGDGDLDALSAAADDDTIAWYENLDGEGSFGPERAITTEADGARSVRAADVDRDGDLDVLAASTLDDTVAWFENLDGGGSFGPERAITTAAAGAFAVVAADVDGDGDLDALAASRDDDTIAWYANLTVHRSGAYSGEGTGVTDASEAHAAGDLDGDGDVDVLASSLGGGVAWHENLDGAGGSWSRHLIATTALSSVVAADLDRDGDLDLLAGSFEGTVAWYENLDGAGSFGAEQPIDAGADGVREAVAADLDGDGNLDVLTAACESDLVAWHENLDGAGGFGPEQVISAGVHGARDAVAADVDGDGDLDVLTAAFDGHTVAWHENLDGVGTFGPGQVIDGEAAASSLVAADLDGDGDLDVAATFESRQHVSWYANLDGEGSFGPEQFVVDFLDNPIDLAAADLDLDGDLDLAVAAFGGGAGGSPGFNWHENLGGDGSSWLLHDIDNLFFVANPIAVAVADVNGDGDLDVIGGFRGPNPGWYENCGGQAALALTGEEFAGLLPPKEVPPGALAVFAVELSHHGREGDADLELTSLGLLFEEALGDPLTTEEANDLIASLDLYRDDGSGLFEDGADERVDSLSPLSLVEGVLTWALPDGDERLRVAVGPPTIFFVVARLTADADAATPSEFRVVLLEDGPSASGVEDAEHDLPMSIECAANSDAVEIDVVTPSFQDLFEDGLLPADWTFERGFWEESGGALNGVPDDLIGDQIKARAIADPAFGGCDACTVVVSLSASNGFGGDAEIHARLLAGYVDKGTNFSVTLKPSQDKIVYREKEDGTVVNKVTLEGFPLEEDVVYRLEVIFTTNLIEVLLNGVSIFLESDEGAVPPFGTVGFQSRSADIHVEDVAVLP
ncbi:MAG: VCBS repeat-containing protein [Actinobacteria bacterium]|nr:VCBS repeat-containing protein [Actinomycetota bacterium]